MSKLKTIVLVLTDRRPSQYVRQGTEESGLPLHLDAPALWGLLNRSKMVDPKTGKYVQLRYIAGCDTIIETEQKARGVEPNPLNDKVYFENGLLSVEGSGTMESLYNFLKSCEWNESNPNRPKTAKTYFREINTEIKAEKDLLDLDELADSMAVLKGLRTRTNTGYSYDTPRIEALLAMFNFHTGDSDAEKLNGLLTTAQTRPSFFMERVNSATASTRLAIMQARDMGAIILDGETASFASNAQNFHKFKKKDADSRIEELINHFLNPKNKADFDLLAIDLEAAQKRKLAEV